MPIPPIIILAVIMCGTAIVLTATVAVVVSRHLSQRRAASRALSTEEIVLRLERIEAAVETTAIEVERLAESSRFTAKLLAGRTDALRS
jgi:hypothetical protein